MPFLTKLDVREYEPNEWVLLTILSYSHPIFGTIGVPRGFITDLASIPRILRGVFNVNGPSRKAAVLHDYLYCSRGLNAWLSRAQCDRLFRNAMAGLGVSWPARWLMWAGVRLGGWVYWQRRIDGMCIDYDFVPETYWSTTP